MGNLIVQLGSMGNSNHETRLCSRAETLGQATKGEPRKIGRATAE
jgi:hypothetical protein